VKSNYAAQSRFKQKHVAQALLVPNFIILFWLVWTPNASRYCGKDSMGVTEVFCMPSFWSWVGNMMLLMPTAALLFLALSKSRVLSISLFVVALPLVIEGIQSFIPSRDPDLRDFLANSLGGAIHSLFYE
jgi:glycopeptide antibiotics resistance protein